MSAQAGPAPQPKQYHFQASKFNQSMPPNLWLIPGDGNLELIAPAVSFYATAQFPVDSWQRVHLWVADLIGSIADENWVVFVDTNPSFSIYTELAVASATHLIVPFKADDSSRVAVKALIDLIYGAKVPHPVYSKYTFAKKAQESGIPLPLLHMFVGNQFTQNMGAAKAFRGISEYVTKELFDLYTAGHGSYSGNTKVTSTAEFTQRFVRELRDFNSAGVVAAHQGKLLSSLQETQYTVFGVELGLDKKRIEMCSGSIDAIVEELQTP